MVVCVLISLNYDGIHNNIYLFVFSLFRSNKNGSGSSMGLSPSNNVLHNNPTSVLADRYLWRQSVSV